MRKFTIAAVAVLAIAGSTAVYAQHRHWSYGHMRMNPEDRAALTDARIAAVHAGLKLSPDQDKLWPPLETAVRDFAKLRIDRANARMNEQKDAAAKDAPKQDSQKQDSQQQDAQKIDDPVARLRNRAENMATSAAAMKKIADAADPLYKTLDDGQKRRLAMLTHRGGGWRHRGFEHGMGGDRDGDRDRGGDRDRDGGRWDRGGRGGSERL